MLTYNKQMKMTHFHCTISSLRVRVKRKWKCLSAKSKQWHCMAYCCEKYVSLSTIEEPFHRTYHFPLQSFQESSLKPQLSYHQTWKQHKVSSTGTSVQAVNNWYLGHWSFTNCVLLEPLLIGSLSASPQCTAVKKISRHCQQVRSIQVHGPVCQSKSQCHSDLMPIIQLLPEREQPVQTHCSSNWRIQAHINL